MHLSCHGSSDWENPLHSGVLLAGDQRLTVADALALDLDGARLIVLSACETGVVGQNLPDELVGLPSALIRAGFAEVLGTLWSVADLSTTLLMTRFYEEWLGSQKTAAEALRVAQRWLRDATNADKAQHLRGCLPRFGEQAAAVRDLIAGLETEPEERTTTHPFWWAAFCVTRS